MALTKENLIIHLRTELGMSRREAQQIVGSVFKIMKDTLSQGENLLISGFGKFSVREKNTRRGRNPYTGENMILAHRKSLVFKTSGVLRKRINENSEITDQRTEESWENKHSNKV